MNNDNNDDFYDDEEEDDDAEELQEITIYLVDDETRSLIEVALNCMMQLSDAQVDETSAENLISIADSIAMRFNIDKTDVEETYHTTDDGEEEIIYKPRGGLFNEEQDDEDESTAEE